MQRVVSVGVSKEAALYFDRVYPNDFMAGMLARADVANDEGFSVPFDGVDADERVLQSLLQEGPGSLEIWRKHFAVSFAEFLAATLVQKPGFEESVRANLPKALQWLNSAVGSSFTQADVFAYPQQFLDVIRQLGAKVRADAGYFDAPTWVNSSLLEKSLIVERGPEQREPAAGMTETFRLTLTDLKLVDPGKLSWEQIIEFRKDEESRRALRQLRLFFQDSFVGKGREHIEDTLEEKMYEYNEAAREWGFATVVKSLSVAFDNHTTLAACAAVMATATASVSLPVAAAAAMIVPLGKTAVEFAKVAVDARKERVRSPVRYLTLLKKLGHEH